MSAGFFAMITEREASEHEMVLEFLRAEMDALITFADLSDEEANGKRAYVLDSLRGYTSRKWLFSNFPNDVSRKLVRLTNDDLLSVRYVNCSPWRSLAGAGLRVIDGANSIRENTFDPAIPGVEKSVLKIRTLVRSIQEGRDPAGLLILAEVGDGRLGLLEGNHRATAYAIANIARPIVALIGSSPHMVSWGNQAWS
jgi:hypothetical protein